MMTDYIIRFLTGDDALAAAVGYTADRAEWHRYRVVIVPSGFFESALYGTPSSLPSFPLLQLDNMPILYGTPHVELHGDTVVCHADIIASAFVLLSRYEEWVCADSHRDAHGRFMGSHSIPARGGFIHRPIVDEYGVWLRTQLRAPLVAPGFASVSLTHDVDTISHYRRLRGCLGGVKRALTGGHDRIRDILRSMQHIAGDPVFTFPFLLKNDAILPKAKVIYFIKSQIRTARYDYPGYSLQGEDFRYLLDLIRRYATDARLGLHASYYSGDHPEIIDRELQRLNEALDTDITINRHHYLRSLQPEDMTALTDCGITHDYTMGYADIAGFRLGTCRTVHFIHPRLRTVTPLLLHPLTMMDCTLSDPKYMALDYTGALAAACRLIDATHRYNGDLCLLWHNDTMSDPNIPSNYHPDLYHSLLLHISSL